MNQDDVDQKNTSALDRPRKMGIRASGERTRRALEEPAPSGATGTEKEAMVGKH